MSLKTVLTNGYYVTSYVMHMSEEGKLDYINCISSLAKLIKF